MSGAYSYDGIIPVVDPTAFVHPSAVLIGDVIVGPECYVGPCAVLRGDFGRIVVGRGANVQETCVVHSFPNLEVIIDDNGHIGHGAVLHGCHIGENVLVGMNAVIMDEAEIGANSIVAALAFVKAGAKIPPASLVVGAPARIQRQLTEDEIDWKLRGTRVYQQLAHDAFEKMKRTVPLTEIESNRRRVKAPEYDPLILDRSKFGAGQD
jgi:phenylacetic acid degradation protein